ncbi:MAG: prevent-host-death family protein [Ignavibacteria bacterium GWB2_35_6b]|nr:MAG: prevent-host-death family protein [Ignavibacteria bacterium GWB2_35_6b]
MPTIAVSKLRENLMQVLKRIEKGTTIEITSHGKVVAKLIPPDNSHEKAKQKLNKIAETAVLYDVISSVTENWEADN